MFDASRGWQQDGESSLVTTTDLEDLGSLGVPHLLQFGWPMLSPPPAPLFRPETLPDAVVKHHDVRAPVAGASFLGVPGHDLGSVGLLRRDDQLLLDPRIYQRFFIRQMQSAQRPAGWVRGLSNPDVTVMAVAGPVVSVLNPHLKWGHFLMEMLPRLYLYAALCEMGRALPLALPEDLPAWASDMIAMYVPACMTKLYHSHRQIVRAGSVVLPSMLLSGNYYLHPMMNDVVHDVMRRARIVRRPESPQYLYLSRRRHSGFHGPSNEDEIEMTMQRLGFAIVHPQEVPLAEQLALYQGAAAIVAPFGSAAHNALFAPFTAAVLCLGWMNPIQSRIAALRAQPLAYLAPADGPLMFPSGIVNRPGGYRYRIDVDELARVVPAFLHFAQACRSVG